MKNSGSQGDQTDADNGTDRQVPCGLFGKLPQQADFVSLYLRPDFTRGSAHVRPLLALAAAHRRLARQQPGCSHAGWPLGALGLGSGAGACLGE